MKGPEEVKAFLRRRFSGKHREWLAKEPNLSGWPLEIPLSVPSETEAYENYDRVKAWAQAWKAWSGAGTLVWIERRWRDLGVQALPERLLLSGPGEVATWVGESARWRRACMRYEELKFEWPRLESVLPKYFDVLADYADADFRRLVDMLRWLVSTPASGLYPRQIPIAGMDSKWLEGRKGLITDLVRALRASSPLGSDFHAVCGLKPLPSHIRFRVLDPVLQGAVGGLADIAARPEEVASLRLTPRTVFIVENVQTALAFPELEGAVAFMGLGYSVDLLASIRWLKETTCLYWGDCDTHGFAILSRMREHLPSIQSVLMDETTLLAHRLYWGIENEPCPAATLPGLTREEVHVYANLKANKWGDRVRLEQERIAWDYALRQISVC